MLCVVPRPSRHDQPADPRLADVHDFVELYELDLGRGVRRPLEEWLRRVPGSEAAIAAEWLELESELEPEDAAPARSGPERGATMVGPYELLRELGRGGQGAVHLARDTRLKREVALKVLSGPLDGLRSITIERLRREAEVIARLEHPSLCAILDDERPRADGGPYADQITYVTDRPGHDRRYAIDARKIARDLGWQPAETFATGIRRTVRWYLDHQDWVANVTSGAYREWVQKHYA